MPPTTTGETRKAPRVGVSYKPLSVGEQIMSRLSNRSKSTTIAIVLLGGFLLFVNTQMSKHTFRNLIFHATTTLSYEYKTPTIDYFYYNNSDSDSLAGDNPNSSGGENKSPAILTFPISFSKNGYSRSDIVTSDDSETVTIIDTAGILDQSPDPRNRMFIVPAASAPTEASKLPPVATEHAARDETTTNTNHPLLRSSGEKVNGIAVSATTTEIADLHLARSSPTTIDTNTQTNTHWTNATKMDDGNLLMEFFHRNHAPSASPTRSKRGMSACLIQLEDTIRLAEWIPYHYATLPLTGLVIALDPNNSPQAISRVLELIDLWKDKIEITLWPDFFLPPEKRYRTKQSYVRERQVYFANQCLAYHKAQNRSWTLLTDNDEYMVFNYPHDDEVVRFDHPSAKKKYLYRVKAERKRYMHLRKDLPSLLNSTILGYIQREDEKIDHTKKNHMDFLPKCVRMPGIRYAGTRGATNASVWKTGDWPLGTRIDRSLFSTFRELEHIKRNSKFSKVMINVKRAKESDLVWTRENHAKTIHNPSKICGTNGASDSGADYFSSLFRLNHYLGGPEAFLERQTDYRKDRSLKTYNAKLSKITLGLWDKDVAPWIHVLVQSEGVEEVARLLAPIEEYIRAETFSAGSGRGRDGGSDGTEAE